MVTLARQAKPGPMEFSTVKTGLYIGLSASEGRLIAMAGERMRLPGYSEVSAVCTHQNYRRLGYASFLASEIVRRILERNDTPFLHSRVDNFSALQMYENMGFTLRKRIDVVCIRVRQS